MAGGIIANTNGMKFVIPPPTTPSPLPHPAIPAITPAAAAGGFVYVHSPQQGSGMGVGFGRSMAVQPYYPGAGGAGNGYYGGGGYEGGYGGGYGGEWQGGRGGKRGMGGRRGSGMGMAQAAGFVPPMQPFYPESAMPYLAQAPYYGPPAPYYAGAGGADERCGEVLGLEFERVLFLYSLMCVGCGLRGDEQRSGLGMSVCIGRHARASASSHVAVCGDVQWGCAVRAMPMVCTIQPYRYSIVS